MFWESNKEKKGKVKLEGCLDTSKDYIQHCKHGIRTDWICSKCDAENSSERTDEKEETRDPFSSSSFKNI